MTRRHSADRPRARRAGKAVACSAAVLGALALAAVAQTTGVPSYTAPLLDSPAPQAHPGGLGGGFGVRVGTAGDLNKDGTNDVFVSAAAQDVGGLQGVGRVWVVDGKTRSVLAVFDHPAPQGGAWFGFAVSALGDIDGDGFPDLAIAAPSQDVNGALDQGKVYVFSGHTQSLLYTRNDPDPQAGAEFGRAMIATGDLNGDGVADFVVGAPRADSSSKTKVGAAYAFSGKDGSLLYALRAPDDLHNAAAPRETSTATACPTSWCRPSSSPRTASPGPGAPTSSAARTARCSVPSTIRARRRAGCSASPTLQPATSTTTASPI